MNETMIMQCKPVSAACTSKRWRSRQAVWQIWYGAVKTKKLFTSFGLCSDDIVYIVREASRCKFFWASKRSWTRQWALTIRLKSAAPFRKWRREKDPPCEMRQIYSWKVIGKTKWWERAQSSCAIVSTCRPLPRKKSARMARDASFATSATANGNSSPGS